MPGAMLAALLLVASSTAATLPTHVRVGQPAPRPAWARVLGALSSSTALEINVTLKPRDPTGLASYAAAVSTPGSSLYHHYLTVAQFRRRFGPSVAQIAAVEASLRAHGLTPAPVSPNGLAIPVAASAARIASAFSLSFERVALPSGRTAFANTQAPQFDTSVAGDVQGVVGLDSISVPSPQSAIRQPETHAPRAEATPAPKVNTGGPQPCASAATTASRDSAYTADQLASAYQLSGLYGAGDQGLGQTIALYELEPNSPADIAAYQSCYGTHASVSYVQVDGGAGAYAPTQQNQQGLEAALDIEDVIGLAPKANVVVYQGPNTDAGAYDTYSQIVSDDAAQVISTSWGLCEAYEGSAAAQAESTLFQEAAAQGQSVFAAAGDNGSEDCETSSLAVDDPASQPYVTGVGGTKLSQLGPPPVQSVWNESAYGAGAGGGGISSLWTMPSYQSGVVNGTSSGSQCGAGAGSYCREVPDVSADADPYSGYVVYWDGGWGAIGGTSAAAPLWAAYMALVNDSSACGGIPVGFANPALYAAAASHYATDFSDVTSGNNDYSGTGGGAFAAATGYDMASGLGTPIGPALAADLCGYAGTAGTRLGVTNPGPQRSALGSPANLQIGALDSGAGATLTYAATGLPAGLSIDGASGAISGTPITAGSSSVRVTVTDNRGASAVSRFSWSVTVRGTATSVSCSPGTVVSGATTTCTVTTSDAGAGTASLPAGTISFGTSASGSFSGSGSCTLALSSASSASCSVSYLAGGYGDRQITASYAGDATHSSSAGSTALSVSAPPAPAPSGSSGTATTPAPSGSTSRPSGPSPPSLPGCPVASGRAGGTTLGLVRLGMTRAQARRAYAQSHDRASRSKDVFCLTPVGVTVGYASPSRLLGLAARPARGTLAGRVVWIATTNRAFALGAVRVGMKLSLAARRLRLGKALAIGTARWYLAPAGGATLALKVRGGVVQEIGLAARQLTGSRSAQRLLLGSF